MNSKPLPRTAKRRVVARPVEPTVVLLAPPEPVVEMAEEAPEFPPGWQRLTPMQRRVFQLVATGRKTNEIAAELSASPRTVQAHCVHIAIRLGLHGRTALQRFVREHKQAV